MLKILICLFICAPAFAQSGIGEVVRIADSVGYEIDPAENEQYALFPQYQDFILAKFLQTGDRYVLRISYQEEGRTLAEDILLSSEQFEAYRKQIAAVDQAASDEKLQKAATKAQKEGRFRMVTDAFLYGAWLYGPGITTLFDIKGTRAVGVQLLTVGGSFVGAISATKDYRLGYGRTNLIRWGNYAGTLYGLAVPLFFESENEKAYVGAAMLGTPLGGLLAHRLSAHRWFKKGETDLITTGGLVGGLYGAAIPYLVNIEDLDNWTQVKIYAASVMAGAPAGVWATTRLIRHKPINWGRAHLITLGGILGGYYGYGLVNLVGVDADAHPRIHVGAAALGLPVGAYVGYRLTGLEAYTLGRARLISFGAYAGALFGNGIALAAGAEGHRPHILASVLGSAVGVWYTHKVTHGWGEKLTFKFDKQRPTENRVTVSLPSYAELLSFGLLARHNPSSSERVPLELIRVSF